MPPVGSARMAGFYVLVALSLMNGFSATQCEVIVSTARFGGLLCMFHVLCVYIVRLYHAFCKAPENIAVRRYISVCILSLLLHG